MHQDVKMVRGDCYKPADYSTDKVQKDFMACAKKHAPALILKYGSPAISGMQLSYNKLAENFLI